MIRPWVHFPEYDLCFAFMPKVANTSMKMAFAKVLGMKQFNKTPIGIHNHFIGMSPEQIAMFDCPKVMFVRNPFDRLVSAWQSKLLDKTRHLTWDKYGMYPNMSFEEFARIVCKTPDSESDHHWRSQSYEMYAKGEPLCITLGRFESLRLGWSDLQRHILKLPDLKIWGASQKKDYRLYYNDTLVDLVSERYKRDLLNLEYEF